MTRASACAAGAMRASRPAARERYTIINRGGYDIVTVTDARGHMLRRYRRFPDGREYGMIDNRRRLGIGAAVDRRCRACSASPRRAFSSRATATSSMPAPRR